MPQKKRQRTTTLSTGRGPLARKVLASLRSINLNPIANLAAWQDNPTQAASLTPPSETPLELDPVHSLYVFAQNQLTDLVEQIIEHPALAKLADAYGEAQDEYLPSAPPMSPITTSLFSAWGFYDLVAGAKSESLTSVMIDVCRAQHSDPMMITLFDTLNQSRLGVYRVDGHTGTQHQLTELITGYSLTALSASGYIGQPGELWLVRVLPPPTAIIPDAHYGVVFNTPYLLGVSDPSHPWAPAPEVSWLAFFERTLPTLKPPPAAATFNDVTAYEHLMKVGLSRYFWLEYVFQAYVNHQPTCIYLGGWPDRPESLPHDSDR